MRDMGWSAGSGLGPTLSGKADPVMPAKGNKDREGLGLRRSRCRQTPKNNISAALVGDSIMLLSRYTKIPMKD